MIRLVATDLDGTLLCGDGTLSPRTLRALGRVADAGAEVVLVTARPPRFVDALAERFGLSGTALCSNGALVYDITSRTVLTARTLPVESARRTARTLSVLLPGVEFAIETGHKVVFTPGFRVPMPEDASAQFAVSGVEELWSADVPIVKLLARSTRFDADAMLTAAREAAGALARFTHSGGTGLLEISAPGVTKAAALATHCRDRAITAAEVVAFGDMPNDLDVLRWAGAGYAVANAHPDVLAAVPRHTTSNDEHGVATVLERHFG
ncbi:HAD family hydrolase [Streptomyces sp. SID3343]|uniref:HAD family hydrolase n=1 Tax=Streptomyces sp. SID3343 TaxID=2690260 RepID=UPI0031F8B280